LGRIGGLYGLLFAFIQWLFGPYIAFEANLRWMKKFYKFKSIKNEGNEDISKILKKNHKISFQNFSVLGIYIKYYSFLKKCFGCCFENGREAKII